MDRKKDNISSPPRLHSTPHSALRTIYGILRATHLFPNVLVALATVVLGLVATRGQPDLGLLARTWGVVMSGHASIGLLNDYLDRERDALTQPYKPIPSGLVPARLVRNLIIGLLGLGTLLALTLPAGAALLAFAATSSGLLYDFLFKDSYLSWVPYLISFSTYPLFVWAALGRFEAALLWLYPPALLLTIGINLANTLPDIETDREKHSLGGLGHLLGVRRALLACWLLFILTPLCCLLLSLELPVNRAWVWPSCGLALVVVGLSIVLYQREPGTVGFQMVWKLTSLAAFLIAVGWLAGLTLA